MGTELDEQDALAALDEFTVGEGGTREVEVDIGGSRRTVDPRPVYDFERDLADRLIESSVTGQISGAAVPIKGRWIHGWLNEKGDDYINNIWHGWQYFLKYVEVVTGKIQNISSHKRSPGTYESMYRYLLTLEDLELIDRYRREEVPEEEYDFNVPEEFRTRTFVKLTADLEGNERKWDNPQEALYGESEDSEDEDTESESIRSEIDRSPDESVDVPDTDQQSVRDSVNTSSDDIDVDKTYELPTEDAGIEDFEDLELIPPFIDQNFDDAVEEAFSEAPIVPPDVEASDIELGRVSIVGPWVSAEAIPQETPLGLFIEIKTPSDVMNPGFIPAGVNRILPRILSENNIFEDVFPSYDIASSFSNSYKSQLKRHVNQEESNSVYYSFSAGEIKEV